MCVKRPAMCVKRPAMCVKRCTALAARVTFAIPNKRVEMKNMNDAKKRKKNGKNTQG